MLGSLTIKRIFACLVAIMALSAVATLVPAIEVRSDLDSASLIDDRVFYRLERDGAVVGFFSEVSGLSSENEVIEYRDGGENDPPRKLPGPLTYDPIVLKRGITRDLTVWNWRQEVVNGEAPRSTLTLTMLRRSTGLQPIAEWHFTNAWPSKVAGPVLRSQEDTHATEEITLVVERMERVR